MITTDEFRGHWKKKSRSSINMVALEMEGFRFYCCYYSKYVIIVLEFVNWMTFLKNIVLSKIICTNIFHFSPKMGVGVGIKVFSTKDCGDGVNQEKNIFS